MGKKMANELEHLVKMINQIGDNQPRHLSLEESALKVSEHINKFWAKPMRSKLTMAEKSSIEALCPIAKEALKHIN